jgi:PIN domain nuclease of toxin-antitoxin system
VRPVPDDPVAALRGSHAGAGAGERACTGRRRGARRRAHDVTVLDAYAVISFLRGETAVGEVATLLRGPTLLPAVKQAEVIDQLVRTYHRAADDVEADLALLCHAGMDVATLDATTATLAGRLRARHYHREHCAVSLADCEALHTRYSGDLDDQLDFDRSAQR